MLNRSQEKEIGVLLFSAEGITCALLFLGEENIYTTVIRTKKLVLYCFRRRNLVLYCYRQTGALHTTQVRSQDVSLRGSVCERSEPATR